MHMAPSTHKHAALQALEHYTRTPQSRFVPTLIITTNSKLAELINLNIFSNPALCAKKSTNTSSTCTLSYTQSSCGPSTSRSSALHPGRSTIKFQTISPSNLNKPATRPQPPRQSLEPSTQGENTPRYRATHPTAAMISNGTAYLMQQSILDPITHTTSSMSIWGNNSIKNDTLSQQSKRALPHHDPRNPTCAC